MSTLYDLMVQRIILPMFDLITGSQTVPYMDHLNRTESLNYDEMKALQMDKLKQVLDNAHQNLDIYSTVEYHENPEIFIKNFPVTERSHVLTEDPSRLIKNHNKRGKYYTSGGSTAANAHVYLTNHEYSCAQATQLHWLRKIGYKYGDRILQIGILKKHRDLSKRVKDVLLNTDFIYYFELSEQERVDALKRNSRNKNLFYIGFPNIAIEIMDLCIKHNINLMFKGILSYGELLTEEAYNSLKTYFKCQILNTYGCQEGVLICSGLKPNMMPIMMQNTYLEIMDDYNNPVEEGVLGNILLTNLNAFNMPLIRYRIKDCGTVITASNHNTFNRDVMIDIAGRDNDYLYTPEGGRYHLFTVSGDANFIKKKVLQFQWHQRALDHIQIKYIPKPGLEWTEEDKIEYTKLAKDKFHSDAIKLEFVAVDELTRHRSGKVQRVINDLIDN
ncbi:MAG: hypothetical protein Q8S24_12490 [Eubacteriales bacterium]|nr:hypothetical protein [Eubacteriales bacterium]